MGTDPVRSALTTAYVQTLLRIKAKQLSRRPEFRRADPADIGHDLLVHVLNQADNYDPSRSSVNTFITRVVETAAAMLVRNLRRIKRAAGHQAMSLDAPLVAPNGDETTMAAFIEEKHLRQRCGGGVHDDLHRAELSADIAHAMEGLTKRQREIARRLTSSNEAAVAREMGISRRQVRNDVLAIREHFRRAGLSED